MLVKYAGEVQQHFYHTGQGVEKLKEENLLIRMNQKQSIVLKSDKLPGFSHGTLCLLVRTQTEI